MTRPLLLLVLVCASGAAAEDETPEQRVELLLGLPHGLAKLSPNDRARLATVKANPAPHLAVLSSVYHPAWAPRATPPQRDDELTRFLVALGVAGELKTPEADAFLAGWYLRLAPERLTPWPLQLARAAALYALGDRRNEQVVQYILSHLEWVDDSHRAQMLTYLSRTCRGDPRVIAELRAILQAKTILYDDGLSKVIKWMEKS
jgi:hypothetical protein